MLHVAHERYGSQHAEAIVDAWKSCSTAFSEFPYHGSVVYNAPMQVGPANPLWANSTGYGATMVGIPYDDLNAWRAIYPADLFIQQFEIMAQGFGAAHRALKESIGVNPVRALQQELDVMETVAIHYQSVAQQARFVQLRGQLDDASGDVRVKLVQQLEVLIRAERDLALRLYTIQRRDSRIGYESSNHYFYVPADLAEKVINCDHLLTHWIPELRE